jgi:hypothetical protein
VCVGGGGAGLGRAAVLQRVGSCCSAWRPRQAATARRQVLRRLLPAGCPSLWALAHTRYADVMLYNTRRVVRVVTLADSFFQVCQGSVSLAGGEVEGGRWEPGERQGQAAARLRSNGS